MSLPLFYQANIVAADAVILSEETSKHCIQVLRMTAGKELLLTDGKGNIYTCTIVSAHKKNSVATITKHNIIEPPVAEKTIAISLLKNASRFEWFIEKAVELGITSFVPLLCSRTEKQQFKLERVQNIVVSAMLQSKQYWLPTLHQPMAYTQAINQFASLENKYIAHCYNVADKVELKPTTTNSIIFIGPEGDFTTQEITLATQMNFKATTLGQTRLRTETAALKAAVLLTM